MTRRWSSPPPRRRGWLPLLAAGAVALASAAGATQAVASSPPPPPPGGQIPLPNPPQLEDLPGASLVPNLSTVPGAPGLQGVTNNGSAPVTDPAVGGVFTGPFAPPGPNCPHETEGTPQATITAQYINCKPAGVSVVVLPNGNILYWDGLEAEENNQYSVVAEFGDRAVDDQSRVLDLLSPGGPTWTTPSPATGGANGLAYNQYLVPNAPGPLAPVLNDPGGASGALFCSDQVLLANGDLLVPGGTSYYAEPRVPNTQFGLAELQGLRNTRIFHPATDTWTQSGPMNYGRWYPSLVTLGNGDVFVASGVTKLIKPVYPANPQLSGTNVEQTETYSIASGSWTYNGPSASRSLPLFPRLHLLPDGNVYYDAGGQTFNPQGQSYDEALWNITAVYNPTTKTWRNLGVPAGVSIDPNRPWATSVSAGFRGSSFSVMLPLTAPYTSASFLSAGGVLGTTPGTYFSNTSSVINTVDTAHNDAFTSVATAPLNNARWFSTAVELPTGQVVAFNGANRDDVVGPGTSFPVQQAEMFHPGTRTWSPLATSIDPRTYHNTAVLLPTGQVLVGGNSPISTGYLYNQNIPGGFSNDFRDPSFELYTPPNLEWGYAQPTITAAPDGIGYGGTFTFTTHAAARISRVVLTRNTALTHLVDGDQRSVVLPVLARHGDAITVAAPPNGNVAPPGAYLLFADMSTPKGLVPSVARQLFVGAPVPSWVAAADAQGAPTAAELTASIAAFSKAEATGAIPTGMTARSAAYVGNVGANSPLAGSVLPPGLAGSRSARSAVGAASSRGLSGRRASLPAAEPAARLASGESALRSTAADSPLGGGVAEGVGGGALAGALALLLRRRRRPAR